MQNEQNHSGNQKGDTYSKDDLSKQKLYEDALLYANRQIIILEEENKDLRTLKNMSRNKIQNLQSEIQALKLQLYDEEGILQMKRKYECNETALQAKIEEQASGITERNKAIKHLLDQEKERERKEEETATALSNLEALLCQKRELEKSLALSREREKCALREMQEALLNSEASEAGKRDAEKHEEIFQQERDNLFSLMEKNLEELRKKLYEKERNQLKLTDDLKNETKFNEALQMRCSRLQEQYESGAKEMETLNKQLQFNITALEEKSKAEETLLNENKLLKKRAEENEKEMQRHIEANAQLKERYIVTLKDLAENLTEEIQSLDNRCLAGQEDYSEA